MTTVRQLRLVPDPAPVPHATSDPTRAVFDHWVYMFGRQPNRTKLDAERRKSINGALALFDQDLDLIILAIDGMAAAPLTGLPASQQDAMRELSWFLATAARIERCLRYGDDLRAMAQQQEQAAQALAAQEQQSGPRTQQSAPDPAVALAAKERLRQLGLQCRSMHG